MKAYVVAAACALSGAFVADAVAKPPDPADPKAMVPALAFVTLPTPAIPRDAVDPPARWREHNERVRNLGGHAGHMRGAARTAGESPAALVPAAPDKGAPR